MNNKRLTYHETDGGFGVTGMNESNEQQKIYACIAKLKDYEDIGFQPSELEQLLGCMDTLTNAQRIRRMNDRELLDYLTDDENYIVECNKKYCPKSERAEENGLCDHTAEDCKKALERYLNDYVEKGR